MGQSFAFVMVCALAACGSKHDGNGDGVDGGLEADAPPHPSGCGSNDDCPTGQFCSGNATCIDDGTCKVDPDCSPGFACDASGTCESAGCGGTHLNLSYVAPNFMIALDRSCSMTKVLSGTTTTKWDTAVAALNHALAVHADDIRWGATLFPDTTGDACTQDGAIPFPVGDGNGPGISALLTSAEGSADPYYPDGPCVTNIDTGVEQAAADPALADATRESYVMLVTDGQQSSCSVGGGNTGTEAAIKALLQRGIKTFVVGFGSEVNAAQMNTFAKDGGEALSGATKYYQADTQDALDQAFQTISGLTISCSYAVDPAPTDLDKTWVYFGGDQLIDRDPTHMGGWDYDPSTMQLTFYGTDCSNLQTQVVTQVDVIFGCDTPPIQ